MSLYVRPQDEEDDMRQDPTQGRVLMPVSSLRESHRRVKVIKKTKANPSVLSLEAAKHSLRVAVQQGEINQEQEYKILEILFQRVDSPREEIPMGLVPVVRFEGPYQEKVLLEEKSRVPVKKTVVH